MSNIPPGDEATEGEEPELTVDQEDDSLPPFPNGVATSRRKLACRGCWRPEGPGRVGGKWTTHNGDDQCKMDLVIFSREGETNWYALRPKPRNLDGYGMCSGPDQCQGDDCDFAHHPIEKLLWTHEKNRIFDNSGFVQRCQQHLQRGSDPSDTIVSPGRHEPLKPGDEAKEGDEGEELESTVDQEDDILPPFPNGVETSRRKLACLGCWRPDGLGPVGGKWTTHNGDDQCKMDLLIFSGEGETNWYALRRKPKTLNYFRLCRGPNRCQGVDCDFAHHPIEKLLWTQEKNRIFDNSEFLQQCQQHLQRGSGLSDTVVSPGPHKPFTPRDEATEWGEGEKPESTVDQRNVTLPPFPTGVATSRRKLACRDCWRPEGFGAVGGEWMTHAADEQCKLDLLIFNHGGNSWYALRPKPFCPKPFEFNYGDYRMCRGSDQCQGVLCNFAHHEVEKLLWTLEKKGQFNISDFVEQCQQQLQRGSGRSENGVSPVTNPQMRFPLKDSHDFRLCCWYCLLPPSEMFLYPEDHDCRRNFLQVRQKLADESSWVLVRQRRPFPNVSKGYAMCKTTYEDNAECFPSQHGCYYPHNRAEQQLWNADKYGSFHMSAFIRAHSGSTDSPLRYFVRKYDDRFLFLCRECFNHGEMKSEKCLHALTCKHGHHDWTTSKALAREFLDGECQLIHTRPNSPTSIQDCKSSMHVCKFRKDGTCPYVHTLLEKDLWELQRDHDVTLDDVIEESKMSSPTDDCGMQRAGRCTDVQPSEPCILLVICPFQLEFVCGTCWPYGTVNLKDETGTMCKGPSHGWRKDLEVCLCLPAKKVIRPLPKRCSKDGFSLCRDIKAGRDCRYVNLCKFGLSDEEVNIWNWMKESKITSLEDAVRISREAKQRAERPEPRPYFPCDTCSETFSSREEWKDHCGSDLHTEKVKSDKDQQLPSDDKNAVASRDQLEEVDGWTSASCEVVRYPGRMDPSEEELLQAYISDGAVNQALLSQKLNRDNYIPGMKNRLRFEEFQRHQILSKYNLDRRIKCLSSFSKDGGKPLECNETEGELFGEVQLRESITEDTDAGQLMSSVTHVWVALTTATDNRVYEAVIVTKERFGSQFNTCDQVYICFSGVTVKKLGLKHGEEIEMKLQFQLDRLPFCRMYRALDDLGEGRFFLFPDVQNFMDVWTETSASALVKSDFFNDSQLAVARYVTASHTGYTPPLVVSGPFGMGKTEIFAHCAAYLALNCQDARVLICTRSNSAADLYVTRLKRFSDHQPFAFRRIYGTHEDVPDEVKAHCLLNQHGSGPTIEDIEGQKIVIVTLSSSLMITREAKGDFTHIFVDEAAQALEPEVIMPLALAVPGTCVVLAGDDEQISAPVYSRRGDLSISILQRLKTYYEGVTLDAGSDQIERPFTVLLSENYRSRKEIVDVLSTAYDGPSIESSRSYDAPKGIHAMAFYATKGQEKVANNSTCYINEAEVDEVVLQVGELMERWPKDDWGEPDQGKVAVVSPYHEQVYQIHSALQDKFPGVQVVGVDNIQGKEFFAVFISTVRTVKPDDNVHITATEETQHGFLSNKQLLMTALTRARDCVVVVGDPVALLLRSSDACKSVWQHFLKKCDLSKSLFPNTLTRRQIQDEVGRAQSQRSQSKHRLLDEFKLVRCLPGEESSVTVFEAQNLTDKASYAIKVVRLSHDEARRNDVLKAVQARTQLNNEGIVRYSTSWTEALQGSSYDAAMRLLKRRTVSPGSGPSSDSSSRQTDVQTGQGDVIQPRQGRAPAPANSCECLVIQMELCNRTLRDWLQDTKERSREDILNKFYTIVSAVEHVHSKGLTQQDISPKNIFLTQEGKVKVENFGRALTEPDQDVDASSLDTYMRMYMSPEQVADERAGVFSLGLLLLEMLVPFSDDQERENTLKGAKQGHYPDTLKKTHPGECQMVEGALQPNPEDRLTAAELLSRVAKLGGQLEPGNLLKFEDIKNREEFYQGERLVGESQVLEYKAGLQLDKKGENDWCIPKTVCAFLNHIKGGVILLGVAEILTEGHEHTGEVVGVCNPASLDTWSEKQSQSDWLINEANKYLRRIKGKTGLGGKPTILPVYHRPASPLTQKTHVSTDGKYLFVVRITVEPRRVRIPRCFVDIVPRDKKQKERAYYVRKDKTIKSYTLEEIVDAFEDDSPLAGPVEPARDFQQCLAKLDQDNCPMQTETEQQAGGAAGQDPANGQQQP